MIFLANYYIRGKGGATVRIHEKKNIILKRVFDIVGAVLLLVLASPVMLFVSLGVSISLGRPVLFRQKRVGRDGVEFEMLKFRSMKAGEEDGWTTGVDERKTRFGNFIRRTSLDELPQLINVLRGDMSLVGPRPEQPRYVEKFKTEIEGYEKRHSVKPGITGLAQIKGLRGDTSLTARLAEDISYIEGWSIWLDIKILFMTPAKMINKGEKYTKGGPGDQ